MLGLLRSVVYIKSAKVFQIFFHASRKTEAVTRATDTASALVRDTSLSQLDFHLFSISHFLVLFQTQLHEADIFTNAQQTVSAEDRPDSCNFSEYEFLK